MGEIKKIVNIHLICFGKKKTSKLVKAHFYVSMRQRYDENSRERKIKKYI